MKPLLDIFSKRKLKIIEKPKIIADYREKNSLVISELANLNIDVELRELKVADYLVNGTAIERKTVSDFISSMLNGRLVKQLGELQQYENKLLMIEGIDEQELYSDSGITGLNPNSVRGFLLSVLLKHKVPIIFTKNPEDSARFMDLIVRKKSHENNLNVKKRNLDKKERMQFILEGFSGIGPKTARKLLEKFKTIRNIANASIEELTEVIGKKAEVFRLISEEY